VTTPTAADTASVLARAQEIRERIVGGGDFGEIARDESADSISAANGGLLDITRGQTVAAFDSAAFSLPIGQVSPLLRTTYGHHILRVESRDGDSASVRHILVPFGLSPENDERLLDRADSLDILAETLKLDEIGRQLGLPVREAELVPGLTIVPEVGIAEDGEFWAFEEGEVGEISQVFESPTAYYVFELVDRQDQRTLTFDEASQTVTAAVRTQKKIDRAMQTAREAAERIQNGQSLEQVAAAYDQTVQEAGPFTRLDFVPGLGRLNPAVGTAFGLRTGQTSGVVESDNKLYLMQLVARQDADRAAWEQQKEQQRQQITASLVDQRWNQFLAALRENADIEDNRDAVLNPPDDVAVPR
jgi:parvulin-like peptidyl-prolyl isomerase